MLRFLLTTMLLLVGWLQPSPTPTEPISLANADRIEQLQQIGDRTDEYGSSMLAVAFSPDGTTLAFGGEDGALRVWNIATNNIEFSGEETDYNVINALVFSPDSASLFLSSSEVTRWSTSRWTQQPSVIPIYTYENAMSPDGSILAVVGLDGIGLYDAATLTEIRTMTYEGRYDQTTFRGIAFSLDGGQIASISNELVSADVGPENPILSLWDVNTGELLQQTAGVWTLWSVAFSPDGTLIAGGHRYGDIGIWDAQTLAPVATFVGDFGCENVDFSCANIHTLVFSANSDLIISGDEHGVIRLWDMATHTEIRTLEGHTGRITDLALSPDGTLLASASYDGTVRLWGVP
jgi:WD40 repeat protein